MKRSLITIAIVVGLIIVGGVLYKGATNHESSKEYPSQQTFAIGSIMPQTGGAAELGAYNREAAELFVSQFSHPGLLKLALVAEDSRSTPKDGLSAAQAVFTKANPLAIMVHQGAVSVAVTPEIAKHGTLMFYIGATDAPRKQYLRAFRIYPDPAYVARQTVDQILLPDKLSRVAFVYANDEFGVAMARGFRERMKETATEIVSDDAYTTDTTDFRAMLTKCLESKPDAVYLVGVGASLGRIVAQLRQLGFSGKIVGGPEIQFSDVLSVAGASAEGVVFLDIAYDPGSSTEPTKSFVEEYKKRFGRSPSTASALVYDVWSIFGRALRKSDSMNPDDLAEAVRQVKEHDGVCGKIVITSYRDFIFSLRAKVIHNGKPEWKEK